MSTLTKQQAKDYYNRYGARQDGQAYYEDPAFDILAEHGSFSDARSVFEFGSGTGRFAAQLFSHHFSDETQYHGVDISETMVDLARENLRLWGDRARVEPSDGTTTLPCPDGSVDRLVCTFVLDLLPEDAIRQFGVEAHRALGRGGLLCIASLADGKTTASRLVGALWKTAFRLAPLRVGGCRALDLPSHLPAQLWHIEHEEALSRRGVSVNVIVARRL